MHSLLLKDTITCVYAS